MILEACVSSAVSAMEAQKGGADRVELCENLYLGGTTPSAGTIRMARKNLSIGLFVMIRPRGGDFLYSADEFAIMQEDILVAKNNGADGVVFGILRSDGTVDTERLQILLNLARPMEVTFHRAFDMTDDPFRAMEDIITLGIDRILTSGQKSNALAGAGLIRDCIGSSAGRIILMPGGGIKVNNISEVIRLTGAAEVHIHLEKQEESLMKFRRPDVHMGRPELPDYETSVTDWEKLRKVRGTWDVGRRTKDVGRGT